MATSYVAVCGFDKVGKQKLINQIQYKTNKKAYHVDYSVFDKFLNRNQVFTYFLALQDLTRQKIITSIPIMDRDIIDSYVYSRLYKYTRFKDEEVSLETVMNYYDIWLHHSDKVTKDLTVSINYVKHYTKQTAEKFFNYNDGNHNDKLDKFTNFKDYYKIYEKANELYNVVLSELEKEFKDEIVIDVLESYPNKDGSLVDQYILSDIKVM